MNIGVIFPQTEFGNDPLAVRDYAQTAEALGYTHVLAFDHVLGANPHRPGGWQMEEQITVLRQLWTQPLVNMAGQWHTIPDAGMKPLPVQQPVPIWFGGRTPAALNRAARLGDGWLSNHASVAEAQPALAQLTRSLAEAGRSQAEFGIEARLPYGDGNPAIWASLIREWQDVGATHAALNTMGVGFDTPAAHLSALRKFAEVIGLG